MVFSQKKIYLVIGLTIISLIGILLVQYFWIDAALKTEKDQFDRRVATVVNKLENEIRSDSELQKRVQHFTDSSASQPQQVSIVKEDLQGKLQAKIDSEFNELTNLNYEFGLVQHGDFHKCCLNGVAKEEVLLSSINTSDFTPILETKYRSCACIFDGKAHINLYFPNKDFFIASQIGGMLVLSVLCILIVVGCFSYTILTIRKQKKLAEMKNDFINNMTHEFKTPIFSISLASKALKKSDQLSSSGKFSKYLDLITDETKRLKAQVNKVLRMALVDSEEAELNKQEVDLHALIERVTENFELILSEQNGSVTLNLNAENHIIHADKTHISNILHNLIDNAIKYSKEEPRITVSTAEEEEGIRMRISDNGIGIDAQTQQHIFDKFYRAQTGDIHEENGFGLGLSYVKDIVEAHKGSIQLNSKIDQGSTFTIVLPA